MADRYHKAIFLLHHRNLFTQISRRRLGTGLVTPVFLSAEHYRSRTAVIDLNGRHTYGQILDASAALARKIQDKCPAVHQPDKETGPRIGFISANDVSSVVSKWAAWMLGGVAVPLSPSHPQSELEYFLQDSQSSAVITTPAFSDSVKPIAEKLNITHVQLNDDDFVTVDIPKTATKPKSRFEDLLSTNQFKKQAALIIYTSGTTGRPKGVVHTHGSLCANIEMMRLTWDLSKSDTLLHVLPLHHIHGLVNCVMAPMSVGATCVMMPKFDAQQVWSSLLNPVSTEPLTRINLFMAVPTIYAKLVQYMNQKLDQGATSSRWTKDFVRSTCLSRIRLMVSGSSALPDTVMLRWEELTGHRLLERYGMTEGMILTNALHGPRTPGTAGRPFPGVEVRLARANVYAPNGYDVISTGNSRSTSVTSGLESESGELFVKGPNLFREYWNKPEATQDSFTTDGWFKTGDTVIYDDDDGYKILGRTSVDIIKSGGYKISALDIERHLLSHPAIQATAVVGLPDITWGQKVAALVELNEGCQLELAELRDWCREKMPPYHIPTVLRCIPQLPYNALGKVNKKEVVNLYFQSEIRNKS